MAIFTVEYASKLNSVVVRKAAAEDPTLLS
jgi:hypothetical protein